jgi:hypothetical protein
MARSRRCCCCQRFYRIHPTTTGYFNVKSQTTFDHSNSLADASSQHTWFDHWNNRVVEVVGTLAGGELYFYDKDYHNRNVIIDAARGVMTEIAESPVVDGRNEILYYLSREDNTNQNIWINGIGFDGSFKMGFTKEVFAPGTGNETIIAGPNGGALAHTRYVDIVGGAGGALSNGMIYWRERYTNNILTPPVTTLVSIRRIYTNGTGEMVIYSQSGGAGGGANTIGQMAVDHTNAKLWWTERSTPVGTYWIKRCSLDGSNLEVVATSNNIRFDAIQITEPTLRQPGNLPTAPVVSRLD